MPDDIDGHDIWDSINQNTDSPRTDLLINYDTGGTENFAVRRGNFKLMHGTPPKKKDQGIEPWFNSWYATAGGTMDDFMTLQRAMKKSITYGVLSKRPNFEERRDDWREAGKVKCKINKGMADSPRGLDYHAYTAKEMLYASVIKNGTICEEPSDVAPCLFDLLEDPCELRQYMGEDRDRIIKELSEIAEKYLKLKETAVAPWSDRHHPPDEEADPQNCGGDWMPWTSIEKENPEAEKFCQDFHQGL